MEKAEILKQRQEAADALKRCLNGQTQLPAQREPIDQDDLDEWNAITQLNLAPAESAQDMDPNH